MLGMIQKTLESLEAEEFSLSKVMPRVIRLAEQSRDAFNYLVFKYVSKNANNGTPSAEIRAAMVVAEKRGIKGSEFENLKKDALAKAITLRRVHSIRDANLEEIKGEQVVAYSISELENHIRILKDRIMNNKEINRYKLFDENHYSAYTTTYHNIKDYVRSYLVDIEMEWLGIQEQKLEEMKIQAHKLGEMINQAHKKEETKMNNNNVFIIHGHNEARWRQLASLLKDEFNLNPIVLSEVESEGMTIIEKFEKYAKECSYAFALITADDTVVKNDVTYLQARPNVIFEIGWFYGQLGRKRVCIIVEEGASVPSDLDGIMQLRYRNSLDDVFRQIQKELRASELI
ncbi:TIR domain-containing protein [Bacillus sp. UNC438CL73TsuS30]|uniref:TIR domain-containing protein n=1 Tax=Bacillus sp. UNC438CL73TsuS30 TaxID=1340434 RepID=UPI00068AF019|nr:nucleotide-binding protein [Bacillus sp. UNC438CL73TsuS30]